MKNYRQNNFNEMLNAVLTNVAMVVRDVNLTKEYWQSILRKNEFWDDDLGPSPRECALRDDYEDLINNPPKDIKVELKEDGKYYLNEERCSPEGFIYKPEEEKEEIINPDISFDEEIPF